MITLDLHGRNVYQARVALRAALKKATGADYRLRVVHGYHSGSALKDMVLEEAAAHPKVRRIEATANPGETVLVLREYV